MELSKEIKNENEKKYNTFNSEELDDNVLENPACIKEDYISFWAAVVDIIKFYLPAAANSIIQGWIGIMDYVFLGYYTKNPAITAALGLGFTWVNVMVKLILSGLLNGLEWLASQAYGREDFKLWELYLNMCKI